MSKVLVPAVLAPLAAILVATVGTYLVYVITRNVPENTRRRGFQYGQIGSASLVSLAHGTNDAQKTRGVITLAMIAAGLFVIYVGAYIFNVLQVSLCQIVTPPQLLGRMNSVFRFVTWGMIPLGVTVGELLVAPLGLREVFWIAAVLTVLSMLPPLFSLVRKLRDGQAPAEPEDGSKDGSMDGARPARTGDRPCRRTPSRRSSRSSGWRAVSPARRTSTRSGRGSPPEPSSSRDPPRRRTPAGPPPTASCRTPTSSTRASSASRCARPWRTPAAIQAPTPGVMRVRRLRGHRSPGDAAGAPGPVPRRHGLADGCFGDSSLIVSLSRSLRPLISLTQVVTSARSRPSGTGISSMVLVVAVCAAGRWFSRGGMVFGRFPKVGADGVRAVVTGDPRGALDAFQRVEAGAGGFMRVPA